MNSFREIAFALICGVLLYPAVSFAKDIAFEVGLDRSKISLGERLQLELGFEGTQDMPPLDLPEVEGLQIRYLGPSTRMSIVNSKVSSSITHIYSLLPLKAGNFKIGPLTFEHNGDTYHAGEINFEVVKDAVSASSAPRDSSQVSPDDISDRVFLVMNVKSNKLYLNEMTPLSIKLYVNRLAVRDIQYPEFSHEGFSILQFEKPKQYAEVIGGVNYDVIEFTAFIFGTRQGEFRLGPASLKCNLLVRQQQRQRLPGGFEDLFNSNMFEDFFGGYQNYPLDLKSADIPVTVRALPDELKPQDFTGAVGDFNMEVSVSPQELKAGDPVTLKITVSGNGNFSTVNMPHRGAHQGFKAYEPQVKQEGANKVFEQVLIPLEESIGEVPAVDFSFFDPAAGKYRVITKGPFPIRVEKPEREEKITIVSNQHPQSPLVFEDGPLGRDIVYIKTLPGAFFKKGRFLFNNSPFLLMHLAFLLVFLCVFLYEKRKRKLKDDPRFARRLCAPKKAREYLLKARQYCSKNDTKMFYDTVFQLLQEYLGDKFHLPSQGITMSVVDEVLKSKGVDEAALDMLRGIFKECDAARYSPGALGKDAMLDTLRKLEEILMFFQKDKS